MSRVLALLAGLALTAGVVLVFANATVFDADGFAAARRRVRCGTRR